MGLLDKVKDLLSKNADKVDTAIDKAGDVVDRKYKGTVDKVEEEAKKFWNRGIDSALVQVVGQRAAPQPMVSTPCTAPG